MRHGAPVHRRSKLLSPPRSPIVSLPLPIPVLTWRHERVRPSSHHCKLILLCRDGVDGVSEVGVESQAAVDECDDVSGGGCVRLAEDAVELRLVELGVPARHGQTLYAARHAANVSALLVVVGEDEDVGAHHHARPALQRHVLERVGRRVAGLGLRRHVAQQRHDGERRRFVQILVRVQQQTDEQNDGHQRQRKLGPLRPRHRAHAARGLAH